MPASLISGCHFSISAFLLRGERRGGLLLRRRDLLAEAWRAPGAHGGIGERGPRRVADLFDCFFLVSPSAATGRTRSGYRRPARPASSTVGISGAASSRLSEVTANAFTPPLFHCDSAVIA